MWSPGYSTNELHEQPPLSDDEFRRLDDIVKLAVRLRAHVTRHHYSREIESIHGAEGPGRLGLSLERLFAGLCTIGLARDKGLRIIEDVALASTPPIRRHAFELLTETPTKTRVIAKALKLPTTTARRALEELTAHGLAVRTRDKTGSGKEKEGGADLWKVDADWIGWPAKWAATNDAADDQNGADSQSNDKAPPANGNQRDEETPNVKPFKIVGSFKNQPDVSCNYCKEGSDGEKGEVFKIAPNYPGAKPEPLHGCCAQQRYSAA